MRGLGPFEKKSTLLSSIKSRTIKGSRRNILKVDLGTQRGAWGGRKRGRNSRIHGWYSGGLAAEGRPFAEYESKGAGIGNGGGDHGNFEREVQAE